MTYIRFPGAGPVVEVTKSDLVPLVIPQEGRVFVTARVGFPSVISNLHSGVALTLIFLQNNRSGRLPAEFLLSDINKLVSYPIDLTYASVD